MNRGFPLYGDADSDTDTDTDEEMQEINKKARSEWMKRL